MIYLDHASTTPTDPRVVKAMLPYFNQTFCNPSSIYKCGIEARTAVDEARKAIADFINCAPEEITFTSGGTESDNMAVLGIAKQAGRGHVITSQFEHPAVLNACKQLDKQGFSVTYLKPDELGFISPEQVRKSLKRNTVLVSIMYANNEIGTVQDIQGIAKEIKRYNLANKTKVLLHSDACQATAYLKMDVRKLGIDLMTINGSKIYGPKGIGLLFIKSGTPISPIIFGGGQEGGLRSGTENVPGIIGLAEAIKLIDQKSSDKERALRDCMIEELLKIKNTTLNGSQKNRLPNNVNISFEGVEGESALLYLDKRGIACSTGSACSSKSLEPSHVLLAIGKKPEQAHCSLRFTIGKKNTRIEIQEAVKQIREVIELLRKISAIYDK